MAITTRYFSTASAGAADGTTWADRAALFTGGAWSTVITGFNFAGTDSLKCLIGPGTHTVTVALASGLFANPPTDANPLIMHGCDSSGTQLAPSNPDWASCEPVDWDSSLPVIATTTNIRTADLSPTIWRLIKFTASGNSGNGVWNTGSFDWCSMYVSSSGQYGFRSSVYKVANCYLGISSSTYVELAQLGSTFALCNSRFQGVAGSSGNRYGINLSAGVGDNTIERCTVFGFGGVGIRSALAAANNRITIHGCVVANNTGTGILLDSTASQTEQHRIANCMVTGNGGYGIDAQSAARLELFDTRLRDNTSGNTNGMGNYPTDLGNYTTDDSDANEYVDASSTYNFTVKSSASNIWRKGYGVKDQINDGGAAAFIG